jgi:microcystin-dependent protein
MTQPYLGEIRMFAGNFAPVGWAFCDGAIISIAENDSLYALIGTTYGGDGQQTFALPDLRGRIPLHQGTGPGLATRIIGELAGSEQVTLLSNHLPNHGHDLMANTAAATVDAPAGKVLAAGTGVNLFAPAAQDTDMAAVSLTNTGGGQSHENMMPSLCVSFIIALSGIYPTQS